MITAHTPDAPLDDRAASLSAEVVPVRHRAVRSFVLRQGRLSAAQARAIRELGPRYLVSYRVDTIDVDQLFGRRAPKILEIGFGMGVATAEIAARNPDKDYLGIEVHTPGVGALLKLVGERGLTNVRIVQHDAADVLRHMIAPASLDGAHVFFPDPWPKKRHHKRRLIQAPFLDLLAARMKPGATLHLATDWADYARHMLDTLTAHAQFANRFDDFAPDTQGRPRTKFELRGERLGHAVFDLVFERRA